jgi:hypothetical protein
LVDQPAGCIEARTGITWKSLGERLSVFVTAQGDALTTVEVRSRPRVSTNVFDYGKNQRNVDQVIAALGFEARPA